MRMLRMLSNKLAFSVELPFVRLLISSRMDLRWDAFENSQVQVNLRMSASSAYSMISLYSQ